MPALTIAAERMFYIGWAKQSTWGTSVTPTQFWRWLDGTEANPETKMVKEREGDSTPFINLVYKGHQSWMIKIKERIRPITSGCALQALLGTNSDTYTAPTQATTLSANVVVGATTFQTVASIGNVSTGVFAFTGGYASSTTEVLTVNLVSRTGSGPYTYTLNGGAAFAAAHTTGDAVNNGASHVFTRQNTTYDPYTIEFAFMTAGNFTGKAFRIQDCVCTEVKIIGQKGMALELEHTWYGSIATEQAGLLTPTFEGTNVVGSAGSPLIYYQGANWTLDGLTTGNAASIVKFDLTMKNSTGAEDLQSETLSPLYFIPGNMDISGMLDIHFQTYADYLLTYYGSRTAPASSTDSFLVGYGQFSALFSSDAINSLLINLPNLAYTAAKITPKLDAKPLTQQIAFDAVKSPAAPVPVTLTLGNTQTSQY